MDLKLKKISIKKIIMLLAVSMIVSLAFSLYQSLIKTNGNIEQTAQEQFGINKETFFSFCCVFALICIGTIMGKEALFRFRYLIAVIALVLGVLLEITGSSIGCFLRYFGQDEKNTVMGISRMIRSDEWAVFSPMTWSQYKNPEGAFQYFNSLIRAESTDVFLEYGLPVSSIVQIYKPFQIGYLFLPVAKGMAFYWCSRFIALFMVSFEFGRKITKDDRKLSIGYAFLISFAPCVQWWFAINGFVEMLFFFQLSLICFNQYLICNNFRRRAVYAGIVTICAGGYILTMYPAWMIPLAYVLLGCLIAVFRIRTKEKRTVRPQKKDIAVIVLCILFFAGTMLYIFIQSKDTIKVIMSTVYPGKRLSTGGGILSPFFEYFSDIWYVIKDNAPRGNTCEASFFMCLFPMGYYLLIRNCKKTKTIDPFSLLLGMTSLFIFLYSATGFPEFIAKITLMRYTEPNRAHVIAGFAQVILLIREMSKEKEGAKTGSVEHIVLPLVFTGIGFYLALNENPEYYTPVMTVITMVLFTFLFFGAVNYQERIKTCWISMIIIVSLFSGLLVNPVRAGEEDIQAIPELKMAKQIAEDDPEAIWMIEGAGFPLNNALLLEGIKTINTTNIYPDIPKWRQIDKENYFVDVYNRYAHIQMIYTEQIPDEKFALLFPDSYQVFVNLSDIKALNIKYVFTPNDLSETNGFHQIDTAGNYKVFAVE